MGDQKVVQDFIKVLLQWDYEDMFDKVGKGEGIVEELTPVPKKFKDLKVLARSRIPGSAPPARTALSTDPVCRSTRPSSRR